MTKPISPDEVSEWKQTVFPDDVFEVFNELITSTFSGNQARVYQRDVVAKLVGRGHSRHEIFANHWLDIEDVYREAGWIVTYDKPAYNEAYEPCFLFKKKK
jgi:hypothetical protein